MSIIGITRIVGATACSLGAGRVAKHIIVATTPENLPKVTKAIVWVGRNVVVMMAGAAASTFFRTQFDETVDGFKKMMEPKVKDEKETK